MARAKKRSKDEGQESGEVMAGSPVRRMEALGIVLLVLALALSFALVSFDPVSYTHLDVYKRQNLTLLED